MSDDILCNGCGNTVEEATTDHRRKFLALLERRGCREEGIPLNKNKLQRQKDSTTFMGHCQTAKTYSRIFLKPNTCRRTELNCQFSSVQFSSVQFVDMYPALGRCIISD
jgi:hypothetical protein